jgi:hypothetical protein
MKEHFLAVSGCVVLECRIDFRGCYDVDAGTLSSLPGIVAWVLRRRKWLIIAYAVLLHLLVYSLGVAYASCSKEMAVKGGSLP